MTTISPIERTSSDANLIPSNSTHSNSSDSVARRIFRSINESSAVTTLRSWVAEAWQYILSIYTAVQSFFRWDTPSDSASDTASSPAINSATPAVTAASPATNRATVAEVPSSPNDFFIPEPPQIIRQLSMIDTFRTRSPETDTDDGDSVQVEDLSPDAVPVIRISETDTSSVAAGSHSWHQQRYRNTVLQLLENTDATVTREGTELSRLNLHEGPELTTEETLFNSVLSSIRNASDYPSATAQFTAFKNKYRALSTFVQEQDTSTISADTIRLLSAYWSCTQNQFSSELVSLLLRAGYEAQPATYLDIETDLLGETLNLHLQRRFLGFCPTSATSSQASRLWNRITSFANASYDPLLNDGMPEVIDLRTVSGTERSITHYSFPSPVILDASGLISHTTATTRIAPEFLNFLERYQAEGHRHLYFNLQDRRHSMHLGGRVEVMYGSDADRCDALEALNTGAYEDNITVVTLGHESPFYTQANDPGSKLTADFKAQVLEAFHNEAPQSGVFIPNFILEQENYTAEINTLITELFNDYFDSTQNTLTAAERQIFLELFYQRYQEYLLIKLQPTSFNMSSFHDTDRGASARAIDRAVQQLKIRTAFSARDNLDISTLLFAPSYLRKARRIDDQSFTAAANTIEFCRNRGSRPFSINGHSISCTPVRETLPTGVIPDPSEALVMTEYQAGLEHLLADTTEKRIEHFAAQLIQRARSDEMIDIITTSPTDNSLVTRTLNANFAHDQEELILYIEDEAMSSLQQVCEVFDTIFTGEARRNAEALCSSRLITSFDEQIKAKLDNRDLQISVDHIANSNRELTIQVIDDETGPKYNLYHSKAYDITQTVAGVPRKLKTLLVHLSILDISSENPVTKLDFTDMSNLFDLR